MVKKLFVASLILLALTFLVACAAGTTSPGQDQETGKSTSGPADTTAQQTPAQPPAEAYPKSPISLIVPFSPGGGFDTLGRQVAKYMQDELGVPVTVKNVPGGGQRIGAAQFDRSKPDGYTIGYFTEGGLYISQLIDGSNDFDVTKWEWVGAVRQPTAGLVVAANSSFKTMQDVLNYDKTIRIPDIGFGSGYFPPHVAMISSLKLNAQLVTGYGGTSEILPALLRDEADIFLLIGVGSQKKWFEQGDLRLLGTPGQQRMKEFPDVPTFQELGITSEDVDSLASTIYAFSAPPGTPSENLKVLEAALAKVHKNPEFLKWAESSGVAPELLQSSGEEVAKLKQTEFKTYEKYLEDFKKFK